LRLAGSAVKSESAGMEAIIATGASAVYFIFIFIFACAKMVCHAFNAHGPNHVIAG
jgi:hypothetical protein